MSASSTSTAVPPKQQSSSPASNQPAADASAQQRTPSAPASKPANLAILNYAQVVGKTPSSAGTQTPVPQAPSQQPPPPSSSIPPTQTIPPANVPALNSYPNGTTPPAAAVPGAPKPVIPPTGPAALNGPRNHSRASSSTSSYRPTPPTGPHSAKPSMSGQGPYGPAYPSQSPRIPANGRNSPYPADFHDETRSSPQQTRNGSIAMARHGSQSSQSGGGQIPPSPRPANNRPPNAPQQYSYGYPNQQPFNPAYNQPSPMQGGRGGFNRQSVSYQSSMQGQFRQGQAPTRSPHAQPIQMAPQMPQMQQMPHMYPVPMAAPGTYVFHPSALGDSNFEYLPGQTDQFGSPQMQQPYVYAQPYHPSGQPQLQSHGYPPTGIPPPPPLQQMFSPPPQAPSYTASPAPPRPMNQPMSRSTSIASDVNHQPPQHAHPPATPSPAPKEEAPAAPHFVLPKKSSAIKIVDPNTKAEVTFVRPTKNTPTAPDRTPSPVKAPVKHAAARSLTHSPAPSVEERPPSVQKTRGEIAEEMKAKVKASMEETKRKEEEARRKKEAEEEEARRKQAEKEEAERLERERMERKKKEEEEQIAREKKEQEERLEKERLEQERIQREKEEEERRKMEEERIAKEKAEEEERLAKEKAEKEAAEAARLAKEKEEEEAKAKEREAAAAAAAATAAATAVAASEEPSASPERRSSVGPKKTTVPSLSITPVSDGLQAAALKKASFITGSDFLLIKYPDGINAPNPQFIQTFGQKGFHYDPEFLVQFQKIWKDKPSDDWDSHIKETMGDLESRPQRPVSGVRGPTSGSFPGGGGIGNFSIAKPIPPRSSIPPLNTFAPIPSPFPSRGQGRNGSSGAGGSQSPASPRAPSAKPRSGSRRQPPPPPPPPPPPEPPVEPLVENPNRWKPRRQETTPALGPPPGGDGKISPEVVQRKVKALLNKLTLEKFDKITDQILEIASQSRQETDGRTLRQIIQLTFEKATDEPNFSEMYALFCRKIMETIDPNITDPTVVNKDGQPLTGGQLFRKYLLNRCQEEFERGWKVNLPPKPDDNELMSDEYYLAAKAKRQGLGLVQFIGELFKLNMLIEKIMYECIIRLLGGTEDPHPEPEEVESLCRLLVTVGKPLDEGKAKGRMNAIYDALDQIRLHSDLESRIKFKILDILELRKNGWVGRQTGQQGPKTIQEIHDDAARAKAEQDAARQTQRNRPEFGRGDSRQEWGSFPRPKADNRAGDMSKLGMLRTSSSSGLGPQTSQFNSLRSNSSRTRTAAGNTLQRDGSGQSSRTGTPGVSTPPSMTSANAFDIFRNESESKEEEASSPPIRKISVPAPVPPADDDEVAEGGYYTTPPMQRVAGTGSVANFVIHRNGFGSIHFKTEVDLTSIPSLSALRELVKIERGLVTVYPDESKKPDPGNGLNVPAKIALENVKKPADFDMDEFLENLKTKPDKEFLSYESETWTYQVEHF